MKHPLRTLLLLLLLLSPAVSMAAQQIRAKPLLRQDKEYNSILLHVAQYFVLTIPDDKTIGDISYAVRCTFVISSDGVLRQLEIENDLDGWTGLFEGSEAKRTDTWLRNAVLDGMGCIPPFDMSQIRGTKTPKKRTVVFSFGKPGNGQSANIPFMGFNPGAVEANLNQSISEQQQSIRAGETFGESPRYGMTRQEAERRYVKQEKPWAGFAEDNIKTTMKPKYEPYKNSPPPVIRTQPRLPMPGDSIPKIEVAVSLQ